MKRVLIELKDIKKQYNNRTIIKDLDLKIYEGEFLTLLGSSGCGKTTILRMISGMEEVTSGTIFMNGQDITSLEPMKREVNTIFQNYALFSHMTIEKNIGFGLKMKKVDNEKIKKEVKKMLSLIKLEGYEDRKPSQLSGGEQQRVAIARALINNPKVLLLDEPLSALDKKLRKEMEIELKMLQQKLGITFIYVTHDQEEALTMSDTVVVMNNGEIQQIGTPVDIYNEPENRFVAEFIGESNIIEGIMLKDLLVKFDDIEFECVDKGFKKNEEVEVVLRPEDINIVKQEKGKLKGKVKSIVFKGVHYEIIVETKHREYMIHTTDFYEVGLKVGLKFDPEDIHVMYKMGN